MEGFDVDSFVFDPRPDHPLLVTANRYRSTKRANPNGLTLILTHGTGFHKEHWDPTLEELSLTSASSPIREIWNVDCPNHGDAAILNERTLQWGYDHVFSWSEYATALHLFLLGKGKGISTDFRTHNLVGVGHSMGAIALVLTSSFVEPIKWHSIIMVEPMLMPKRAEAPHNFLEKGAEGRRDIWPSKEEAYKLLSQRKSFKAWDPRILKLYCDKGLRNLPTLDYPEIMDGVTLKCTKKQEAACYRDRLSRSRVYDYLSVICNALPVHVIYGAIDDYTTAETKEDVIDNAAAGRFASVQRIKNAGHLVVQTHPSELAKAIHRALVSIWMRLSLSTRLSKL